MISFMICFNESGRFLINFPLIHAAGRVQIESFRRLREDQESRKKSFFRL